MLQQFYDALLANNDYANCRVEAKVDERQVVHLTGTVARWQQAVDIGHMAAGLPGVRGVVNDLGREKCKEDAKARLRERNARIAAGRARGVVKHAGIVVVGAGVSGAAIARILCKYDVPMVVVEKCTDVSEGTSKANNGIIHPGHDPKCGTLKAKSNVRGNALYDSWARELGFTFTRPGQLLLALDEEELSPLQKMYENARSNGVPGTRLVDSEEALMLEPRLGVDIAGAMWLPTSGYVDPYEVVVACLDHAIDNGAELMLETEVLDVQVKEDMVQGVVTDRGIITADCVINAAGVYADEVAEMAGDRYYSIHPRRGTLIIFDKAAGTRAADATLTTLPGAHTKGGGNMKTISGNPLWGPSAREVPDKDDMGVDEADVQEVMGKVLTAGVGHADIIRYFSGVRAATYMEDFIIEPSQRVRGFIHVAGIQSPGLAAAPAIAEMVEEIYRQLYPAVRLKPDHNPLRDRTPLFNELPRHEQKALVEKEPAFGCIVCRCETVTEGDVLAAIRGRVPALTLDAVKRRTRCGMGRCQGGFCLPRIIEVLARELGIAKESVTLRGPGTEVIRPRERSRVKQHKG